MPQKLGHIDDVIHRKTLEYTSKLLSDQQTTSDDVSGGWSKWLPVSRCHVRRLKCDVIKNDWVRKACRGIKSKHSGFGDRHERAYVRLCINPVLVICCDVIIIVL